MNIQEFNESLDDLVGLVEFIKLHLGRHASKLKIDVKKESDPKNELVSDWYSKIENLN